MARPNHTWLARRKKQALRMQTETPPAEELLKSVNDTANNARNLFVTYVVLSVYIFLTVGGTNDEQLFRDSGVAVPFLEHIDLPVSKFYQFTPWMFVFVHVDVLLLFKLLADKLHDFNAELKKLDSTAKANDLRHRLSGLPFIHWLSAERDDRISHLITGLVVWSSLFVLPLLTLIALQIGFLPYHSAITTGLHRAALGLDALMLYGFWPRLAAGLTGQTWRWWLPGWTPTQANVPRSANAASRHSGKDAGIQRPRMAIFRLNPLLRQALRRLYGWLARLLLTEINLVAISIGLGRWMRDIWNPHQDENAACRLGCRTASFAVLLLSLGFAGGVAVLPGDRLEADGVLTQLVFDEIGTSAPNDDEIKQAAQLPRHHPQRLLVTLRNQPEIRENLLAHLPLLHRNLDLHEKTLLANEPSLEILEELQHADLTADKRQTLLIKVKGLDLQNRDLRFAKLSQTKLWKADLREADLRKVDFSGAWLQEIQWGNAAQLQGMVLRKAQVGSADFSDATFALNDFRQLDTAKPYSEDDFKQWQTSIRPLIRDQEQETHPAPCFFRSADFA